MNPVRKILAGLGICGITCALSVLGFRAAGWSWVDATYMVIITISGVGYGEVHPVETSLMKMQTMVLIVVGGLSGLYSVGGFIQLVTEGEIRRALGAHQMSRGIRKLRNHTIICGFGRVGQMLAKELKGQGKAFVVVDTSSERLLEAELLGSLVVEGDASQESTLRQAGIGNASHLACVLPNDAMNVFITLTARELSPNLEIVARAEDPTTEHKLRRSGANHVVMPAAISAVRMAQILSTEQPTRGKPAAPSHSEESYAVNATNHSKRLLTIPVCSREELEATTLSEAQQLLLEVGEIVGIQRSDCGILTELEKELELGPEDILLVSDRAAPQHC